MGCIILKLSSRLILVSVIWTIIGVVGGRFIIEGSHLAYASQDNGNTSVMLLDVDRKLSFRLSSLGNVRLASDGVNRSLNWSPDGKWIAFVSDINALKRLNLLNMDGTTTAPLAAQSLGINVDWSPDSQHLIYTAYDVDTLWDSLSITLAYDREVGVLINTDRSDYGAAWSPRGEYLAYVSDERSINTGSLFIVPAQVDGARILVDTRLTQQVTQSPLTVFSPVSWSPDGKRMVFSAYVEHYERQVLDLYHLDLRHSPPRVEQLTRNARDNIAPVWSPDSAWVTYISNREGYQAIYLQSMGEKRQIKRLTDRRFMGVSAPMWSYDGRWLVFSGADRSGNSDIYLTDVLTDQIIRVTDASAYDWSPSWRP
jgi:Tol biopolymer transport system component